MIFLFPVIELSSESDSDSSVDLSSDDSAEVEVKKTHPVCRTHISFL